jgi:hypothetical protein
MAPRLALIGSRSRPTVTVDTFALEIMPQELNWRNSNLSLRILRTEARKYLVVGRFEICLHTWEHWKEKKQEPHHDTCEIHVSNEFRRGRAFLCSGDSIRQYGGCVGLILSRPAAGLSIRADIW